MVDFVNRNPLTSRFVNESAAASLFRRFTLGTGGFDFARNGNQFGRAANGDLVLSTQDVSAHIFGLGILLEDFSTNLFFNSFVPSTQTITVAAVAHTITVKGTGNITVTGVGSGIATEGSPLTLTPTAGGLICTVNGTLTNVNVEVGSVGSSFIETFGATASRSPTAQSKAFPFRPNEMSFHIKMRPNFDGTDDKGSFVRALTIQPLVDSGTDNNSLQVFFSQTIGRVSLGHRDGLGAFTQIDVDISFVAGDLLSIRGRKSKNGIKFWVNAETPAENSGITADFLNAPDKIALANRRVGSALQKANGVYASSQFWSFAQSDTFLGNLI
jgi:hypothetical protein